jgi:DNA-binding PadR family transcriptional regulator
MTTFDSTYDTPWGAGNPSSRGEGKWRGRSGGPRAWQAVLAAHQRGGRHGFGDEREFGFGPGSRFGPFGPFGPGHPGPLGRGGGGGGGGGGRRARRGDVRLAALLLLAEEPRNGYAIMQELEQRSGGLWRPSPGSVYPALAQLEDEGLIRSLEADGGRAFELTDAGKAQVAERPEDAPAPWDTVGQGVPDAVRSMFGQLRQLAMAMTQVARSGSTEQAEKATAVLDEARRSIYRILADGDTGEGLDA